MVEGQYTSEGAHMPSIELQAEQEIDNGIVLQTSRSGYIMYPYLLSVYGLGAGEWTHLPIYDPIEDRKLIDNSYHLRHVPHGSR